MTTTKGTAFVTARGIARVCDSALLSACDEAMLAGQADSANGLRGCTLHLVQLCEEVLRLAKAADVVAERAQREAELAQIVNVKPRLFALSPEDPLASVKLRTLDRDQGSMHGAETWRGTLLELVGENAEDVETCETAAAVARDGISRNIGGGAQPLVEIERIGKGR